MSQKLYSSNTLVRSWLGSSNLQTFPWIILLYKRGYHNHSILNIGIINHMHYPLRSLIIRQTFSLPLELVTFIRFIPQGTVDNNLPRARPFSRSKGSRSQSLQTTNPLLERSLSGCPNCVLYWIGISHTHTINIAA